MSQDDLGGFSGKNRRKSIRYNEEIEVEMMVKGLETPYVEKSANISGGGLFVCTNYEGDVDEKVHLRIIFPKFEAFFDVRAAVRWLSDGLSSGLPKGLGLEFVDLTEKQTVVIKDFLNDFSDEET